MRKQSFAALLLLLVAPVAAHADPIDHNGHAGVLGLGGFNAAYTRPDLVTTHNMSAVWAGQHAISGFPGSPDAVAAYCLDILKVAQIGTLDMTVRGISEYADPATLGDTPRFAVAGSGVLIGQLFTLYAGLVASDIDAAALQLAIWEVILEPVATPLEYDLAGGRFRVSGDGAAMTQATGWAASLLANSGASSTGWWLDYSNVNGDGVYSQDFGVPHAVPEPTSLALLGFGLFTLGFAVRRRRKQA